MSEYSLEISVAAGPPWGSARELSLSPLTRRGDPPPPGPREGDVTTPYSRRIAGTTVGSLLGERVVLTIRERASTPPFTQEVLVAGALSAGALSAAAFAGGVGGMDIGAWRWRRTPTPFPLNIPQRGYADTRKDRLRPGDPATVIRQVSAFS